jgi:hypothetical protein
LEEEKLMGLLGFSGGTPGVLSSKRATFSTKRTRRMLVMAHLHARPSKITYHSVFGRGRDKAKCAKRLAMVSSPLLPSPRIYWKHCRYSKAEELGGRTQGHERPPKCQGTEVDVGLQL